MSYQQLPPEQIDGCWVQPVLATDVDNPCEKCTFEQLAHTYCPYFCRCVKDKVYYTRTQEPVVTEPAETAMQVWARELLPAVQAMAEGKVVEKRHKSGISENWKPLGVRCLIGVAKYRIAKPTHIINGYIVPVPESKAPDHGELYWFPAITQRDLVSNSTWGPTECDRRLLLRGLVFLTRDAARRNALAMLGLDPEKELDHGY